MERDDYGTGHIDFRRRSRPFGHAQTWINSPRSIHFEQQALIPALTRNFLLTLAVGLVAGFGLGLAYAMLMITLG